MKADLTPDSHDPTPVRAVAMLFPRYSTDEPQQLSAGSRTASFVLAAYHSFNYSLMGMEGFEAMEHFMENVDCFDLVYHDLDWAVARLEALLA